jgi:hypothetical protein
LANAGLPGASSTCEIDVVTGWLGSSSGCAVDGKVFYRRCGKDSFQVHGNDFFLTRDKE